VSAQLTEGALGFSRGCPGCSVLEKSASARGVRLDSGSVVLERVRDLLEVLNVLELNRMLIQNASPGKKNVGLHSLHKTHT